MQQILLSLPNVNRMLDKTAIGGAQPSVYSPAFTVAVTEPSLNVNRAIDLMTSNALIGTASRYSISLRKSLITN